MKKSNGYALTALVFGLCLFAGETSNLSGEPALSRGQKIYVPAYSHIYAGDRESKFLLTVTVSVRNIDPARSIRITNIAYYETQGRLLQKLLDRPVTLEPLESKRHVIPESNRVGGSGANFIVEWESEHPANPPIVESIMIGTQSGQGISFASRGQPVLPSETP